MTVGGGLYFILKGMVGLVYRQESRSNCRKCTD
jgi:hypothetical protein